MRALLAVSVMASGIAQAAVVANMGHLALVRCQDACYGHAIAFLMTIAERMIG